MKGKEMDGRPAPLRISPSGFPSFVRASRVKDGGYSGIGVRDEVWYKHCRI